MMEIISISEHNIVFQSSQFKNNSNFMTISHLIQNKKPRFFNEKFKQAYKTKVSKSFGILMRPCYHKIFPTSADMKFQLYSSTKKNRLKNLENSYFHYQQYFLSNLNFQIQPLKMISQFSSYDLEIDSVESFSKSFEINSSKKDSSLKRLSKGSLKTLSSKKLLKEKKWKMVKASSLFLFSEEKNSNHPLNLKLQRHNHFPYNFKINTESKKRFPFYFSNFPKAFSSYQISLKSSPENSSESAVAKIQFKSTELQNFLFKNFAKSHDQKPFHNHYLSRLILRNQIKKKRSIFETQNQLQQKRKDEKDVKSGFQKSSTFSKAFYLKSFLYDFSEVPFFEYSLEKKYNFFANQRLFASSFYKYQFKNGLKVPVLKDLMLNQQIFRSPKFIQRFSEQNNFASSFYDYPFLKNALMFKNPSFGPSQNTGVGFTNFYSSYEGEILKDYSTEKDKQTLKKGFNINLDTANLLERENQQLILTQDDFVTFPFYFNDFALQKNETSTFEKQSKSGDFKEGERNVGSSFFEKVTTKDFFKSLVKSYQRFQRLENHYFENLDLKKYAISDFTTTYKNKNYLLKKINFGLPNKQPKLRLGKIMNSGDPLYSSFITVQSGQVIHLNKDNITLRKAEFFSISPKAILHTYNGHCLRKNSPVMTLPFETLKTGDIVQGIPKVEQYLEARTTIQGRLFLNSLPVLLYAIYQRYSLKMEMEKAVRQSFLKIQQILVDGVQRVYRSQGVGIADKHLEIIVRQMTSKVKIIHGGQTGFVAGELVDLEFVERINTLLMIKIRYEPVVLGITRASLEVDSFLSAASFQQTTKVLTRAALENKKDFLKGLKENLLVGNLLPAGTGYILPILS